MLLRERISRATVALFTSVFIGALCAGVVPAHKVSAYNQPDKYNQHSLRIKLKNSAGVSNNGTDLNGGESTQINNALHARGKVKNVAKLFNKKSNSDLDNKVNAALGDYYTVNFDNDIDMGQAVSQLKKLDNVEAVYPVAKPAPLPSADYSGLETYLQAAPSGVSDNFAKTFPGGIGERVKIIDIEYSWNTSHKDLTKAGAALIPNGTPVDPFSNNNHGTAAVGVMVANADGSGTSGIVPNASLGLINAYSNEYGYDLVGALTLALNNTKPGDIVMIEQQTWGATADANNYVAVEYLPEVYDAIKVLTNSGRTVVEPAGNGGQNLDDPVYGAPFPMGKPDSGAIIVGAGNNCTNVSVPMHARLGLSSYGSRVNLYGPGDCVVTTGYGDLDGGTDPNTYYTQYFSGTSSAAPVIAASAASLSSAYKALNNNALATPAQIRSWLSVGGTAQDFSTDALSGNIGVMPDLAQALLKTDITAPSAPTNLKVALNTSKKPVVSWNGSSDNYKVYLYMVLRNGFFYRYTTSTSFTDSAATTGGYTYKVKALDYSGNQSAFSNKMMVKVR